MSIPSSVPGPSTLLLSCLAHCAQTEDFVLTDHIIPSESQSPCQTAQGWKPNAGLTLPVTTEGANDRKGSWDTTYFISWLSVKQSLSWVTDSQHHLPCWEDMRAHKQQNTWNFNAGKAQLKVSCVFSSSLLCFFRGFKLEAYDKLTQTQK